MSSSSPETPPIPEPHEVSADLESAIRTATADQLEVFRSRLREDEIDTFEDARESVRDWTVDECRVADIPLDEQVDFLEAHAHHFDLALGPVDVEVLGSQITGLSAYLVGALAESRALTAIDILLSLLETLDLELDAVFEENPYARFRPSGERRHAEWQVYEYRHLEGGDAHIEVDLFEYEAAGITLYVRHFLENGTAAPDPSSSDPEPATAS